MIAVQIIETLNELSSKAVLNLPNHIKKKWGSVELANWGRMATFTKFTTGYSQQRSSYIGIIQGGRVEMIFVSILKTEAEPRLEDAKCGCKKGPITKILKENS